MFLRFVLHQRILPLPPGSNLHTCLACDTQEVLQRDAEACGQQSGRAAGGCGDERAEVMAVSITATHRGILHGSQALSGEPPRLQQ